MTTDPTLKDQAVTLLTLLSEQELPELVVGSDAHIEKGFRIKSVEVVYGNTTPEGPVNPETLDDSEPLLVNYLNARGEDRTIDITAKELRECDAEGIIAAYHEYLASIHAG